jgi:hypothetical protein
MEFTEDNTLLKGQVSLHFSVRPGCLLSGVDLRQTHLQDSFGSLLMLDIIIMQS